MKSRLRYLPIRWLSTILALSVLGTQCLFGYQVENNFWSERRKSTRRTSSTLLASLPLDAGSVGANSLTAQFPAPQRVGSTLSPSIARSVPQRFSKEHAKILSALSPAHGTIRKVSFPKDPSAHGPMVIHIQDVHMNQEAQWNIRETVKSLLGSGQVNLIALEGATEPIDLQAFVDYPHAKAVEMSADYLLKENKISGPIHAALTARGKLPKILGIDDPTHYEANVQAYRDSAPKLEKTRQEVRAIQKEIDVQKRIIYSSALQSFDQKVQRYRAGKSSLGEYVRLLGKETDPDREGFAVRHFLTALDMERTLDFKQVESERARLIERLTQTLTAEETNTLVAQSLDYRTGHLRYADFYTDLSTLCEKKGIHLKSYPALDSYVKYVLLADGIDAEQLMAEIATLEKRAYARQIKTPEEKSLAARSRQAWLTGKLVEFALTPTEWEEYAGGLRPLAQEVLSSFENFYKEAHARDIAMAKNLLQAMKDAPSFSREEEKSVSLFVTGGFHAEGITQQLTRHGATVLSYIPKIEKVDTAQGSTYLSVFTQEKSPLEKLFFGNKLFLATNPASLSLSKTFLPALVILASAALFLLAGGDATAQYAALGGIGIFTIYQVSPSRVTGRIKYRGAVSDLEMSCLSGKVVKATETPEETHPWKKLIGKSVGQMGYAANIYIWAALAYEKDQKRNFDAERLLILGKKFLWVEWLALIVANVIPLIIGQPWIGLTLTFIFWTLHISLRAYVGGTTVRIKDHLMQGIVLALYPGMSFLAFSLGLFFGVWSIILAIIPVGFLTVFWLHKEYDYQEFERIYRTTNMPLLHSGLGKVGLVVTERFNLMKQWVEDMYYFLMGVWSRFIVAKNPPSFVPNVSDQKVTEEMLSPRLPKGYSLENATTPALRGTFTSDSATLESCDRVIAFYQANTGFLESHSPVVEGLQQYLDDIQSTAEDQRKLRVLVTADDQEINAFALPDGTIIITWAMISMLSNGDKGEIVSVLLHERNHVVLGHHDLRADLNFEKSFILRLGEYEADQAHRELMVKMGFHPFEHHDQLMRKMKDYNGDSAGAFTHGSWSFRRMASLLHQKKYDYSKMMMDLKLDGKKFIRQPIPKTWLPTRVNPGKLELLTHATFDENWKTMAGQISNPDILCRLATDLTKNLIDPKEVNKAGVPKLLKDDKNAMDTYSKIDFILGVVSKRISAAVDDQYQNDKQSLKVVFDYMFFQRQNSVTWDYFWGHIGHAVKNEPDASVINNDLHNIMIYYKNRTSLLKLENVQTVKEVFNGRIPLPLGLGIDPVEDGQRYRIALMSSLHSDLPTQDVYEQEFGSEAFFIHIFEQCKGFDLKKETFLDFLWQSLHANWKEINNTQLITTNLRVSLAQIETDEKIYFSSENHNLPSRGGFTCSFLLPHVGCAHASSAVSEISQRTPMAMIDNRDQNALLALFDRKNQRGESEQFFGELHEAIINEQEIGWIVNTLLDQGDRCLTPLSEEYAGYSTQFRSLYSKMLLINKVFENRHPVERAQLVLQRLTTGHLSGTEQLTNADEIRMILEQIYGNHRNAGSGAEEIGNAFVGIPLFKKYHQVCLDQAQDLSQRHDALNRITQMLNLAYQKQPTVDQPAMLLGDTDVIRGFCEPFRKLVTDGIAQAGIVPSLLTCQSALRLTEYVSDIQIRRKLRQRLQALAANELPIPDAVQYMEDAFNNYAFYDLDIFERFIKQRVSRVDDLRFVSTHLRDLYSNIRKQKNLTLSGVVALDSILATVMTPQDALTLLQLMISGKREDAELRHWMGPIWSGVIAAGMVSSNYTCQENSEGNFTIVGPGAASFIPFNTFMDVLYNLSDLEKGLLLSKLLLEKGVLSNPRTRVKFGKYLAGMIAEDNDNPNLANFLRLAIQAFLRVAEPEAIVLPVVQMALPLTLRTPNTVENNKLKLGFQDLPYNYEDILRSGFFDGFPEKVRRIYFNVVINQHALAQCQAPQAQGFFMELVTLESHFETRARERGYLEAELESDTGDSPGTLAPVDALMHLVKAFQEIGKRGLQVSRHFLPVTPAQRAQFDTVYDAVPTLNKLEFFQTLENWAKDDAEVQTLLNNRLLRIEPGAHGGSLYTVYRVVLRGEADTEIKAILKVLNPNAKDFIEKNIALGFRIIHRLRWRWQFRSELRMGRRMLRLLNEWMLADIQDGAFPLKDEMFRNVVSEENTSGLSVACPKLMTPAKPHIRLEEQAEGVTVNQLLQSGSAGDASKNAVRATASGFIRMLTVQSIQGVQTDPRFLMHPDVHPGNVIFDESNSRLNWIDRSLFQELTLSEARLLILVATGNGLMDLWNISKAIWTLPENRGYAKWFYLVFYGLSLGWLRLMANFLREETKENRMDEFLIAMRKTGLDIPLRIELGIKNIEALERMLKDVGEHSLMDLFSASPGEGTGGTKLQNKVMLPSTLSRWWSLFSDSGPLDHILRLAKWESAPLPVAMGLAVGEHFLLGVSLGWAFGVAILAGALGGAHWFGTYGVVEGKLQEVVGQNSLGKAFSWFLWTSAFGVSLYLLGSVLPQDLVAFGLFLGTWTGTYLGVKGHELSNRKWVVNNLHGLTEPQREMAKNILKKMDGRPSHIIFSLFPFIAFFSSLLHGIIDGWGRIFRLKMKALILIISLTSQSLTAPYVIAQEENGNLETSSSAIVNLFKGPEYLIRALMLGISPENKNEFELIRLPEAQQFMKNNISSENIPIPVAVIDLSNGEEMPTVLTKNMALDNHGSSMADIVHQVAGDQAEVWTLSGGFKSEAGDYNMSGIGKAVQYAVREGARVIMISLSGDGSNEAREAIKEALDKGVIVVMAVGNDGLEDTAILPSYDERILMVGSVLGNGERAPESNFGKTIEGVKVVDIFAPGRLIVTLPDGKKDLAIGTSFTPSVVGGLAVLLLSINNNLNSAEVTDVIEGTASNKRQGLPVVDFLQAVRKIIPVRRNSPGKFSPSTLEWFWRWMPDRGALHDVLQRGPRESVPPVIGMGFAMLAYVTMGASFGWVVAVALVTGFLGYSHRWGTYGFRNGQLVPRTGMVADSVAKAASWFFWITVFGGLLWGLGQVVPSDLVPSVLALGTWVGAYIGFDRHRRASREYIVNNIPDLSDSQRIIAREILKNLDGRPITLDMNQMRELVVRTAESVGRRKDIGAIDLLATSAQSSPGIKFMFVGRASLTAKGLENLRAILAGDENVFFLSDAPVPGIPEGRTVVIPFRPLPQGSKGNLPFREVLLTEVRSRIETLAPDHLLRRRSSDAVSLFHTPDLKLKGEGLAPNDPLAEAAKNPMVLLLESFRAFPVFNQAWQDSLKALRALAEFA